MGAREAHPLSFVVHTGEYGKRQWLARRGAIRAAAVRKYNLITAKAMPYTVRMEEGSVGTDGSGVVGSKR